MNISRLISKDINMAKQFTDDNFQTEVLEASKDKPVLVDFFAEWCGPCKMQGPVVDELAREMEDKAVVGKLDTQSNQKTAGEYGVMSIPTLIVFRNGEAVETLVGMQPKENLIKVLEQNM